MIRKYINLFVLAISAITVLSGLVQWISPATVLSVVKAEDTEIGRFFFGIVGMFMALFGSLMIHSVYSARSHRPAIFWCAMQKLGAFIMVALGVYHNHFAFIAMGVAIFDLASGLIFLYYLRLVKNGMA